MKRVRSRAVRSRDGSVRIALNASLDRHTAVSESLSMYRGSGLNHVAFGTSDIFSAIPQFVADGLPLLRIPRNYYDDPCSAVCAAGRPARHVANTQHSVRP
jgi:4-hydroxyphenylpyruvate dioxygenase